MDPDKARAEIQRVIAYAMESPENLTELVGTDKRATRTALSRILDREPTQEQVDAVFDFGEAQFKNVSNAVSVERWVN